MNAEPTTGLEPVTSCLQGRCAASCATSAEPTLADLRACHVTAALAEDIHAQTSAVERPACASRV